MLTDQFFEKNLLNSHNNICLRVGKAPGTGDQLRLRMREREEDVISRLITEGSFCHLLNKIFLNLDIESFVVCGQVCVLWRQFLVDSIWR